MHVLAHVHVDCQVRNTHTPQTPEEKKHRSDWLCDLCVSFLQAFVVCEYYLAIYVCKYVHFLGDFFSLQLSEWF